MSANASTEFNANASTELNDVIYYREQGIELFNFKIVSTQQVANIAVPTNLCIANFIEFVKNKIYETFAINRNANIEIVEAGQGTPYIRAEDAPGLEPNKNITVREKYNGVYGHVSFYVRISR
jgi:hypothetical protein